MNEQYLENWEPDRDIIEWAQRFFDRIAIGDIWAPEGSGVSYVKTSDHAWSLLRMMGHPMTSAYHTKFKKTFAAIDVEILEKSSSDISED